jgi:hypothetical protein
MVFEGGKPVAYGTSIMSTQKNPSFDFIFIVSNQRRDHATNYRSNFKLELC